MNKKIIEKIKYYIEDETGMGVLEVILIIVVLVGLAVLFKSNITDIVKNTLSAVKNQVANF